jgi:hypothetical protein
MFRIDRVNARLLGGAAVAALVLGTGVGAEAATHKKPVKKTRTVTINYQGGCGLDGAVVVGAPGACVIGGHYNVTRKSTEKFLNITVKDQTGRPVGGEIWLSSGTGNAVNEQFCGSLKNYQMGQDSYQLDLNTPSANPSCPGGATTGTITVKYSNVR